MPDDIPHVPGVDHEFVDAGGLRTHVALAGEGPPVLLLHGWPQHWYLWRDVIPLVAPHARVIAPDLRGFGWTDVPPGGYDKQQLKRDVLALLDELGIDEFTVAGHDWGGYVGFLLALEHPDRVKGLLGLNILPPWPPRDPRVALDSWRFLYMPLLATPGLGRRAGRTLAARGLPDEADAFVSRLHGERGRATEQLYRTFLVHELPVLLRGGYSAADLRVPTKIVFGQRDVVITTRAIEDAAAQSDQIELELVADATHFVVDEKPELVSDRLLGLLAR
ncbi:MAG TPA: alpha/beta hydrolase [Thermoleophilaceae bacterium]|nr:alpha/beta hydrolase [Thermoleophilaceae bacterium]